MAQNLARQLSSVVIISMREERYCRARTAGVLDAYQNSGFHLAAPRLEDLFKKRLRLASGDLGRKKHQTLDGALPDKAPYGDLKAFILVCLSQFRDENNALRRFLEDCSRDNMRIALSFFAQFISSGYTHVAEMIAKRRWTVIGHQVIKPMMVPERFNCDEDKSLIPNVFQCRTSTGSHLTMMRILLQLRKGMAASSDRFGFTRVESIIDGFDSKYGMREDCETCIDVMLRHGMIEANNRLDSYSVVMAGTEGREKIYADEIRVTAFGIYVLESLCSTFTYLELVSLDCGLSDEAMFHSFCTAAAKERALGTAADKKARLVSRIERARNFVSYLEKEEQLEMERFMLAESDMIAPKVRGKLEADLKKVEQSAKKNL
jgi:hypothetical protein